MIIAHPKLRTLRVGVAVNIFGALPSEEFVSQTPLAVQAHPIGANVSARAMAHPSRKRTSLVPSISSPGRSEGYSFANDCTSIVEVRCEK
jgi:hypothetical protein